MHGLTVNHPKLPVIERLYRDVKVGCTRAETAWTDMQTGLGFPPGSRGHDTGLRRIDFDYQCAFGGLIWP